ncbi:MAG: hypothetical protein HZC44_07355 [Geobacter sp.]|nr:hypothetical protein [Geobacter sp.]
MNLKKNLSYIAIFVEFIAGSGLAIFFHMVLNNESAAYITFGIGILLSLVTYLVREEIEKSTDRLLEQYHQAHEIPFAIARIGNPECQLKAQELMAGTKRTIAMLQQGYEAEIQKVLLAQHRDDIDVRIVYREELPTASDFSSRDIDNHCDFAIYDERVVTEIFPQSGKFFGRKTNEPVEVAKYLHQYDLIEHSAHAVAEESDRIILATDALALAC